jgi:hypothetical protein
VRTLDPGQPHAIAELSEALRALTRAGQEDLLALPLPVFFAPQGDRWSPVEHARHLTKSSRPLLLAFALPRAALWAMFGRPPRPSRTYAVLRSDYRAALAAGGQAGGFAPSREPTPADPPTRRAAVLGRWAETNEKLAARVAKWSEEAADAACIKHPLLGPLTVREMAAFTVYHTVHHLTLVRERLAQDARDY